MLSIIFYCHIKSAINNSQKQLFALFATCHQYCFIILPSGKNIHSKLLYSEDFQVLKSLYFFIPSNFSQKLTSDFTDNTILLAEKGLAQYHRITNGNKVLQ